MLLLRPTNFSPNCVLSNMFEVTTIKAPIKFKTVPGDPIQVKMHTLANGLKLFLTINKNEPRVFTEIAVRAGSKHDPADSTGLAHYFEHMMFKGTDQLGSLDWVKEKALLDKIEALFETHRNEPNPIIKKELYAEIDRLSFEAAKYAAANEYDKLVSSMGAKNTNAYTWVEQTVYVNDIPSNELERWFRLESERFRRPVLRLFHTELETVFEEFNISQDKDFRKVLKAAQEVLTPSHPYGTQTTLGRGEDLKNPSQTNIYQFFDRYYVPNNMAISISGDFDPQEAVRLAEQYFGKFEAKKIPTFQYEPQPELQQRTQRDVYGNEAPWVEMAWRCGNVNSDEAKIMPLVSALLYNGQAGLFDLNIVQQQKLLDAYAHSYQYEDFGQLILHGNPREGQTHADVEQLMLEQVRKLQHGEFEDWLLDAVRKDMKLSEIKSFQKNSGRTSVLTSAFILGINWTDFVRRWDFWANVGKADIMAFAQKHLRPDNYVVVYKHSGEDKSVMKVEKPPITPIEVNRTDTSLFASNFLSQKTPDIAPEFLDYKKSIKKSTLSKDLKLFAVQDKTAKIFRLHYTFDMGKNSDQRLSIAAGYLNYLGTSTQSPVQIQQAFYRIGAQLYASCNDDHFYLTLSGLEESFDEALALMHEFLSDLQPNTDALHNMVADVLQRRENNKKNKQEVLNKAMLSYAMYGHRSPMKDRLSKEQLLALTPQEITDLLRKLLTFKHEAFYYGSRSPRTVGSILKNTHPVGKQNASLQKVLKNKKYKEIAVTKDKVVFVHFPTVQVELMLVSKGTPYFNMEEYIMSEWYNQYFGYGLSSIVFQEIRESKALAYSAYAIAANPARKDSAHFLRAYVGTQPDKLRDAVDAFRNIMENMPISIPQMESARLSVIKQIAAGRIINADIYWNWRSNIQKGFKNKDLREEIFRKMESVSPEALIAYHQKYLKGRKFTWLVLGDRERMDFKFLKKIGKVEELSIEEVFGY